MCYPCTQCNCCGKFDNDLLAFMIAQPTLHCLTCSASISKSDIVCPACGKPLSLAPGVAAGKREAEREAEGGVYEDIQRSGKP
jgi:predicted amidophosphoribosyltransferase